MKEELEPLPPPHISLRGPLISLALLIVGVGAWYDWVPGGFITSLIALCAAAGFPFGRPWLGLMVGIAILAGLAVIMLVIGHMMRYA